MSKKHDTAPATPDACVAEEEIGVAEEKLIAFEIAESAKKQVTTWAKWIVGTAIVVGAALGIRTWQEIHTNIKNATDKQIELAKQRSDDAIALFDKELETFRSKSQDALASLEEEIQTVRETVQQRGHQAQLEIAAAVDKATAGTARTRTVARQSRQRPISPGISISGKAGTAQTICCVVKNPDNNRFILTARYAFAEDADDGRIVVQPGALDGGKDSDAIGSIAQVTDFAMLIRLNDGIDVYYDLPEIGKISGIAEAQIGDRVRKFGRTTGFTQGIVRDVNYRFRLDLPWTGSQMVYGILASRFTAGGDTGAAVVNDKGELLGMTFAGSASTSIFLPIKPILEELGVEVVFAE